MIPCPTLRLRTKNYVVPLDQTLFANCHASSIVLLPTGKRLVAFFGGDREGAGNVAIWLVQGTGSTWEPPRRLMAEDGLAHWNPVLLAEGTTVWLFYKVGATVHDWVTRWSVSRDGGQTWSRPTSLVPGDTAPRGPVKNKLLVLSNGDWLAPASVETETRWDAFVDLSTNQGASWRRTDIPFPHRPSSPSPTLSSPPQSPPQSSSKTGDEAAIWSGLANAALWETDPATVFRWDGVIQPSAWESAPGRVHVLMRSTRGVLYRANSTDYGRSWTPAYATDVPNNNSGIDLTTCGRGTLALAYNPIGGNWGVRSPLSLALSVDNGTSFHRALDLETQEGEFSYPAIIASGPDLHVTYTFNRTSIVYAVVTMEDA